MGISVSPCEDAAKIGYDDRQINRIVIRMAQYFLDRDTRVIFGHGWREDGGMRTVADFAAVVAARTAAEMEERLEEGQRIDVLESRVQRTGTMSVRGKSPPLNSRDSPVWRASAYAQQSPRFKPAG